MSLRRKTTLPVPPRTTWHQQHRSSLGCLQKASHQHRRRRTRLQVLVVRAHRLPLTARSMLLSHLCQAEVLVPAPSPSTGTQAVVTTKKSMAFYHSSVALARETTVQSVQVLHPTSLCSHHHSKAVRPYRQTSSPQAPLLHHCVCMARVSVVLNHQLERFHHLQFFSSTQSFATQLAQYKVLPLFTPRQPSMKSLTMPLLSIPANSKALLIPTPATSQQSYMMSD